MGKRKSIILISVLFVLLILLILFAERLVRRSAAESYFIGKYSGYTDISNLKITQMPINRLKPIKAVCNDVVFQIRLRPFDIHDNFGEKYIEVRYNRYISELVYDIKKLKIEFIQVDYFDVDPTADKLYSNDNKFILSVWLKGKIESSYGDVKEQLHAALESIGLTGCSGIYIYESYIGD